MSLRARLAAASRRNVVDLAIVAVGGLLTLALAGYLRMNLHAPARLTGDHLFLPTFAKSYIDGHGFRLNDRLGYPGAQDNLFFPTFDYSYRVLLWIEGHLIRNPFAAVHGMYIAGLLAMFGFAYWTLRRLEIRPWLAAIAAVSSVLTPFLAARAFAHDFLSLSFTVPLGLGTALLIVRSPAGGRVKDFLRDPYVIATVIVAGTSGLYYAFYTAMFVCLAGAATSLAQRRWFPLLAAMGVIVPLFILLILGGYGLDLPLAMSPRFAGPTRFPFEQLVYGIEINSAAKAFHFIPKVAAGQAAAIAAVPAAFTNDMGEWPQAALTLIILASPFLAILCFQTPQPGDARPSLPQLVGLCALFIVFGLLFGVNGGLGYFFNLIVTPQIRADERLMPFLTFAAILIMAAAAEMAARSQPALLRYGVPAVIALVLVAGWKPYVNVLAKIQRAALAAPDSHLMLTSFPAMLAVKDAVGSKAVLELPVVVWPEAAPIQTFEPYQHQLAYIYDRRGSPTRWSYGANPRQPWYGVVSFAAAQPQGMVQRVRALGFDAVLIAKRAYDPAALASLQAALGAQVQPGCLVYQDDLLLFYSLTRDLSGRPC